MDLNRNQFFLAGLVVCLLGIQLRLVDGFVLNERATQFLAQRMQAIKGRQVATTGDVQTVLIPSGSKHRVEPPSWLGWALVSVGSVLILHSLALKKPGA